MSLEAAELVGAWCLERFTITFSDGREPVFPFGEDAQGQLTYTASGHMSAVLSRGAREPLGVPSLEHAARATVEDKAAAFSSYLSYAGTYRVEGSSVVHAVELSLVPESAGTEHVRRAELVGDRLTLSYELTARSGVVRSYTLAWRRRLVDA